MDGRSRLHEDSVTASGAPVSEREARLLRLVDIMRAEREGASGGESAEDGGSGFRWWRGVGLILAGVVGVTAAVVVFLHNPGPTGVRRDAPHDPVAGTAMQVQPVPDPVASVQRYPSPSTPPPSTVQASPAAGAAEAVRPGEPGTGASAPSGPSQAAVAEPREAEPPAAAVAPAPPEAVSTPTQSVAPAAPPHEAEAASGAPPTQSVAPLAPPHAAEAASGVPPAEAAAGGPDLRVYYPAGSSRAEASARNLTARIGSNVTNSDVRAESSPPDHAVIRFSGERDHTLARMIGRSLGDAGYRWTIENTRSRSDTIEVWLPAK
jgi:hypothetical protein